MAKKAKCGLCGKQFDISWWGGLCPYCINKKKPASSKRVINYFSSISGEKWKKFIYGVIVFIFAIWLGGSETGQHLFWNFFD